MNSKLKLLFVLFITICVVGFLGTFSIGALELNIFNHKSGSSNDSEEPHDVQGIVLDNLNQSSQNAELIIYKNGDDGAKFIRYKMSTGREQEMMVVDKQIDLYFSRKFAVEDDTVYMINTTAQEKSIIKFDIYDRNSKKVILNFDPGVSLIGLKYISTDEIYVTSFVELEDGTYQMEIDKFDSDGKANAAVFTANVETPKIVIGKQDEELIYRDYYLNDNLESTKCYKQVEEAFEEVYCQAGENIQTLDQIDQGYLMGQFGNIWLADKDLNLQTVLAGSIDEQFVSTTLLDNEVYFISGALTFDHIDEAFEDIGSFSPIKLERVDIETLERTSLVTLPAALQARIEYASRDFILVGLSEKSSDKEKLNPYNLWIYDHSAKTFEKLFDMKCSENDYCSAGFVYRLK